jgi:hypothetical protein
MPEVTEGDIPSEDRWEVATIVKKRLTGRNKKLQYLVRWKNFSPEDDTWMDIADLEDCAELIEEYERATGNTTWTSPWAAQLVYS